MPIEGHRRTALFTNFYPEKGDTEGQKCLHMLGLRRQTPKLGYVPKIMYKSTDINPSLITINNKVIVLTY